LKWKRQRIEIARRPPHAYSHRRRRQYGAGGWSATFDATLACPGTARRTAGTMDEVRRVIWKTSDVPGRENGERRVRLQYPTTLRWRRSRVVPGSRSGCSPSGDRAGPKPLCRRDDEARGQSRYRVQQLKWHAL